MENTEPQVVKVAVNTHILMLQQAAAIDFDFAETLSQFLGSGGTTDGLYGKYLRAAAKNILQTAAQRTLISK